MITGQTYERSIFRITNSTTHLTPTTNQGNPICGDKGYYGFDTTYTVSYLMNEPEAVANSGPYEKVCAITLIVYIIHILEY